MVQVINVMVIDRSERETALFASLFNSTYITFAFNFPCPGFITNISV